MDRDGLGNEGAPGYCLWGASLQPAADLLRTTPARARSIYRDFPSIGSITSRASGGPASTPTPPVGDSGAASAWGSWPRRARPPPRLRDSRDPALARFAWQRLGRKLDRVHGSIFSENPEALREEVARLVSGPEPPLESGFMDGWGLAMLQSPNRENGRALWVYYGRNTGHGHKDRLNLGLYAENIDMLPDLGYPEYASGRPKDSAWCRNNASHNVVTVDGTAQNNSYTGRLPLIPAGGKGAWWTSPAMASTQLHHLPAHRLAGGRERARSYVRSPGARGKEHTLVARPSRRDRHRPRPEAAGEGTFAGPDVPFEALDRRRSRLIRSSITSSSTRRRVRSITAPRTRATGSRRARAAPAHSQPDARAGGGAGGWRPAPDQRGAPGGCATSSRAGREPESTFVTLLEPYDRQPFIRACAGWGGRGRQAPRGRGGDAADGRRDADQLRNPGRACVDGGS